MDKTPHVLRTQFCTKVGAICEEERTVYSGEAVGSIRAAARHQHQGVFCVSQTNPTYHIEFLADHPAYAEEVGQLKMAEWLRTSPDRPYEVWIDEIRASAQKDRVPMTLLALRDGEVLGFVSLVEIDDRAGIERGVWLITLYVREAYRCYGIGTALIERCIAEGRRMGRPALYLWTETPQLTAYYARRGWQYVGQDEDGEDVMVYELAID
jgi:GNAT superfamily N-acetyltransferase